MTKTDSCQNAGSMCGVEYTVRRGDSFYLIAHRMGITLKSLLEANPGINPAHLTVGDRLCIPTEEDDRVEGVQQTQAAQGTGGAQAQESPEDLLDHPAVESESGGGESKPCTLGSAYTMAEGETAADLQLANDLTLHTLEAANPGRNLFSLRGGDEVCLPRENVPCPTPRAYTLLKEDTLESVALKKDVSVASLLRANPCLAPSGFREGAVITLPLA